MYLLVAILQHWAYLHDSKDYGFPFTSKGFSRQRIIFKCLSNKRIRDLDYILTVKDKNFKQMSDDIVLYEEKSDILKSSF